MRGHSSLQVELSRFICNLVPRKTLPCWEHGREVLGEAGLSSLPRKYAQSSSDPVLHNSHFLQPRVHALPNVQSSGNWATETKTRLVTRRKSGKSMWRAKDLCPKLLRCICQPHFLCSSESESSLLTLKYLLTNCWDKILQCFWADNVSAKKSYLTGCNKWDKILESSFTGIFFLR